MTVAERIEGPRPPAQKTSSYRVEVRLRSEFADPMGLRAMALLREAGLIGARAVRTSRVYEISGAVNLNQVQQAARELLCDAVTEELLVTNGSAVPAGSGQSWRVEVRLKPSVTDAPGETVRQALLETGLSGPLSVRCATVYRVAGKCARGLLEKCAQRCLANPVIHHVGLEVE